MDLSGSAFGVLSEDPRNPSGFNILIVLRQSVRALSGMVQIQYFDNFPAFARISRCSGYGTRTDHQGATCSASLGRASVGRPMGSRRYRRSSDTAELHPGVSGRKEEWPAWISQRTSGCFWCRCWKHRTERVEGGNHVARRYITGSLTWSLLCGSLGLPLFLHRMDRRFAVHGPGTLYKIRIRCFYQKEIIWTIFECRNQISKSCLKIVRQANIWQILRYTICHAKSV